MSARHPGEHRLGRARLVVVVAVAALVASLAAPAVADHGGTHGEGGFEQRDRTYVATIRTWSPGGQTVYYGTHNPCTYEITSRYDAAWAALSWIHGVVGGGESQTPDDRIEAARAELPEGEVGDDNTLGLPAGEAWDDEMVFMSCVPSEALDGVPLDIFPWGGPYDVNLIADAADEAAREISLPVPTVGVNPTVRQLAGLTTYFWIGDAPGYWQSFSNTIDLGGFAVTATITPTAAVWDTGAGEGALASCIGPGRPYDPENPPVECGYQYRIAGDYDASVVVTWEAEWVCVPGCGAGVLDPFDDGWPIPLEVGELQAVIR